MIQIHEIRFKIRIGQYQYRMHKQKYRASEGMYVYSCRIVSYHVYQVKSSQSELHTRLGVYSIHKSHGINTSIVYTNHMELIRRSCMFVRIELAWFGLVWLGLFTSAASGA